MSAPSFQYHVEPTPHMLAMRAQVSALFDQHAQPGDVPTHDAKTLALWLWLGDDGVLKAERATVEPHPRAVVASWNSASRYTVSRDDLLDAVMMELLA